MVGRYVALGFLALALLLLLNSELRSVPNGMKRLDKVADSNDAFSVVGDLVLPLTSPLEDSETLISFPPLVVRAQRLVEYCQWVETKNSNNEYSYAIRWNNKPVNSNYFHSPLSQFRNPKPFEVPETVFDAFVRLQTSGLSVNSSDLYPVLSSRYHKFRTEDYAQLKKSK